MSYNLAVWEGERPETDDEASEMFDALYARYQGTPATAQEPTPAVRRYVEALLAKYPDLDDGNEDDTPWSDSPLIANANGPFFYFGMVFSQAETASEFAAELARDQGLVCFDPQSKKLC